MKSGVLTDERTEHERSDLEAKIKHFKSEIARRKDQQSQTSEGILAARTEFKQLAELGRNTRYFIVQNFSCVTFPRPPVATCGEMVPMPFHSQLRHALADHFLQTTAQQLSTRAAQASGKFAQKPNWTVANVYSCFNYELVMRYRQYVDTVTAEFGNKNVFPPIEQMINSRPCGNGQYLLYHGCSWDVLPKILSGGFRKEYAKERPLFGRKIYFADHSSKSACYCRGEDGNNKGIGVFRLIVARVFLGRCEPEMRGNCNSVAPSPGYHSNRAVLKDHGGSVYFPEYMISDNDGAVPEAVIEFAHMPDCMCSQCELRPH